MMLLSTICGEKVTFYEAFFAILLCRTYKLMVYKTHYQSFHHSCLTYKISHNVPITDPTWIFFTVLAIILFAPMLLERLRIPSIVGMIFAGVLVGSNGIGLLERNSSFELFGKVGLYYIMFLASLEMNLRDVQRIKMRAATLGLLSFIIPITMGYFANTMLLGYAIPAAVLMAAMYASHTLIAYPIVMRYGLSRLQGVNIAVGGTIIADTLTLVVLAVVGGMFKENVSGLYWVWLAIKVLLLGCVIIFLFPPLGRWFFRRYDDGVVQYIFVLSLVFLGAGLMELVGMEGILGAFLAGLALNRLIPPSSPLMSHIEFVGNALFIPYFLIGVGMLINLHAIVEHPATLIIAAVMVVVGLISKWLAAFFTQKIFKMGAEERSIMFGLTGSRAAATLAVVLVGYRIILPDGSRLLGEEVLNGAMVLILVTCIVSPLITENTARKLILEKPQQQEHQKDKSDRIMIALNNPETIAPLVNMALMLRTPHTANPILALNVVLEGDPSSLQRGEEQLKKAVKLAAAANIRIQTFSRWSVNVVSGISHTIKECNISDVVIGMHQKTRLTESFYGKLSQDLLASVKSQILIYRSTMPLNTIRHINVIAPGRAEFEQGFDRWMERIALVANQLSCSIDAYSHKYTIVGMQKYWEKTHKNLNVNYHEYKQWNNLLSFKENTHFDDLTIFICARRGTISHHQYIEKLPEQIERFFSAASILLIFPEQPATDAAASLAFRAGVPLNMK